MKLKKRAWKKKAQGRALFWIVFTLAAAVVIIFLISKWGAMADYLGSIFG